MAAPDSLHLLTKMHILQNAATLLVGKDCSTLHSTQGMCKNLFSLYCRALIQMCDIGYNYNISTTTGRTED